jgi:hypothetical protein
VRGGPPSIPPAPTLRRLAVTLLAPIAVMLLLGGCRGEPPAPVPVTITPSSATPPPPTYAAPVPTYTRSSTARSTTRRSTTSRSTNGVVRGRVYGLDGAPMAGVIVEFKNLAGGNGHTTTGSDGSYAIRLPPDVYTALALTDQPDSDIGFDVIGGDNSVSVPETTRVDFRAYDIGSR